jgi:ADP-heptose:LPS heptosyltransferase
MAVVSPRPLPDHPTVIVLRALPGLGDWLCVVPTLRAIRAARPTARIHLVGLAGSRGLVGRFGGLIDGFHAFPGWPGLPEQRVDVRAIPGVLAALQGLDADIAIQLHGSGEMTNEIVELFGARNVAGFYRPGARCPDRSRFLTWRDEDPEVRRGLRLLALLGIPASDARLEFPMDPAARPAVAAVLRSAGAHEPFVVVHPGGTRRQDRWPAPAFAAVGRDLAAMGLTVVVTGVAQEAALTASVAAGIPGAVDLGAKTTLDEMAGVLGAARLVVTNDTGVSHLADALRVPSVVVFANDDGTRAARWAPLDAALHVSLAGVAAQDSGAVAAHARRLLASTDPHRREGVGAGTRVARVGGGERGRSVARPRARRVAKTQPGATV